MNEIHPNFLSAEECEWFIRFFERNKSETRVEDGLDRGGTTPYRVLDLYDFVHRSYEVKYLLAQLTRLCPVPNSFVEYFQIVRRTEGNELTRHIDFEDMVYSGIVYLNDRYEGGRTYLEIGSEQTVIVPEIGKAIGFDGARIPHGIFPVTKGIRFAVSCWWKTMDWVPADVAAALTRTPMRLQDPMFLSEKQNPDFPYAD